MQERRITDHLQQYWDKLRDGRPFPMRSDVRPQDLKDIWDNCFLISTQTEPFQFDYLGLHFFESYGAKLGGVDQKIYDSLIDTYRNHIIKRAKTVTMSHAPMVDEIEEIHEEEAFMIKYRLVLLPLSNNGSNISHVLGGMRWRGENLNKGHAA